MSRQIFSRVLKIIALELEKQKESVDLSDISMDEQPLAHAQWNLPPQEDEGGEVVDDDYGYDDDDYDDPCAPGGAASDCKDAADSKHGTKREIADERQACIDLAGENNCPSGGGGSAEFCALQQKLCNCEKDYQRHLCARDKAIASCKANLGCDHNEDDLNADCFDPSLWDGKRSCRDADSLCDPGSSDARKCSIIKNIVDKVCSESKEDNLREAFEACYSTAAEIEDKEDRACAICNCGRVFVNGLKASQVADCNTTLAAGCPAGSESSRMKAWNRCMEKITDPTDGSGWFDKCSQMQSGCNPPTKKPAHWSKVKASCNLCRASGGGTGGGHRPDQVRPERPTTRPRRPRPGPG